MRKHCGCILITVILLAGFATVSLSETIEVHFEGFGYEIDGFEYSAPGDSLTLVTRVTSVGFYDPTFPYFPDDYEYTLVVTGLVSNGEMVNGIETMIVYNLGTLAIYEDLSFNSDWDIIPGFPDPPACFTDGELWLYGDFTDFLMLIYRDYGMGTFEGHVELNGGSAMPWFTEDGYTFGGTLVPPHDPDIPEGYDLSVNGKMLVEEPVSTRDSSWSAVKALY